MKYTDSQIEKIKSITPENCRIYLSQNDWKLDLYAAEKSEIWDKSLLCTTCNEMYGVCVGLPLNINFKDYVLRMSEFISTVAKTEKLSIDKLIDELLGNNCKQNSFEEITISTEEQLQEAQRKITVLEWEKNHLENQLEEAYKKIEKLEGSKC